MGSLSFKFTTNERNGLLFYSGAGGNMAGESMGGGKSFSTPKGRSTVEDFFFR